ncbi:MAG: hypothetical protein P4L46_26550 [Fimbriimonas sp.]|nr:hypothetical protein [Fimbriimonas sp.]
MQRTREPWKTAVPARFALHPLSRTQGFTFTMYGTPPDLSPLRQLVDVMKRDKLRNGFDPGQTTTALRQANI